MSRKHTNYLWLWVMKMVRIHHMGNTGKGILWDSHVGSGTLLWGTDVKERAGLAGFEFQLCHPALELLCVPVSPVCKMKTIIDPTSWGCFVD